jgi:hypothetical protein
MTLERRSATRYNFGAIAEVTDLRSRDELVGVTRDVSLSGCFVKTPTPFAQGTQVRVSITSSGEAFATAGRVTGNVIAEGMGIEFVRITPRDRSMLEKWLSSLGVTEPTQHKIRNLHEALSLQLTNSTLKDRFSVGFNPQSSRWTISFNKLSDSEFKLILDILSRLRSGSTQCDVGGSDDAQKTTRVGGLTNTQAREFAHALATRFREQD